MSPTAPCGAVLFRNLFRNSSRFAQQATSAPSARFLVDDIKVGHNANVQSEDLGANSRAMSDIDQFLNSNGWSLEEAYEYVANRTSNCRLGTYYPDYFHTKHVPFICSELKIDKNRPSCKQRFRAIATPVSAKDTLTSQAFSPNKLPASFSPSRFLRQISKGCRLSLKR